jgi:hypothetical protein
MMVTTMAPSMTPSMTPAIRNSRRKRTTRGQTMVLSVVTMLTMALVMAIGFNIAHTAHERIRIQGAADAQAYSVAVLQARSFNVNAVLNKVIASLLVAQMSLHAWNNIASHDVDMLNAGFISFLMVSAYEAGKAKCSKWTPWHCWDAIEALFIAFDYQSQKSDFESKLQQKEQAFNDAVEKLYKAKKDLYAQQKQLASTISGEIKGGKILKDMLKATAPQAKYAQALDSTNDDNFKCSMDGLDGNCGGSAPLVYQRGEQSKQERSKTMQNSANAARGLFNLGMSPKGGALLAHKQFEGKTPITVKNPSKMMNIQGSGKFDAIYLGAAFESRVGSSQYSKGSSTSDTAANVGSASGFGFVKVEWRHGKGGWILGSSVYSSQSGGEHNGAIGDSSHNRFKGICTGDDEACFVTFRAHDSPSEDNDWGQPNAYGAVTQDLRLLQNGGNGAFEVSKSGTVTVKIGKVQEKITLVPTTNGVAVAKAKAYFHQLGAGWKLPPNGFDPFWRAKLHPFKRDELKQVLTKAGDSNASVQGPVEGSEQ